MQYKVFRYGADSSRFVEEKIHRPEEKWSELVYYDAPRCILCFRCVRVCDEGMDVKALGVGMRGANSVIIPNRGDHLECEECGMCIDICPVGARSEEHTSELQSRLHLVCRLLLEKKKTARTGTN